MKPILGILVSAITATFVCTLIAFVLLPEKSTSQFVAALLTYSFVGSLFAIFSALIFGWPLSLIFRRFGFIQWWQFCIGGVICAFPLWAAWFYPFDGGHWEAYRITNSLYFYGIGSLGGFLYWWFVVRHVQNDKLLNN